MRRSTLIGVGLDGAVSHVFTHFPLELTVYLAPCPAVQAAPPGMRWTARESLGDEPLPTLMKKVLAHVFGAPSLSWI